MNKLKIGVAILIIVYLLSIALFAITTAPSSSKLPPVKAANEVVLEFFYTDDCPTCKEKKEIISTIEKEYNENITVYRLSLSVEENEAKWINYGFSYVPAVVIKSNPQDSSENRDLFTW